MRNEGECLKTTVDGLLNRRITFEQPEKGYRVAVDTVLLAAAVPARAAEKVLELGCGVGGAMLALACRASGVRVTGIELQPELVRLCQANIERNRMQARLQAIQGDAARLPKAMEGAFDLVLMNPPYHAMACHDASPLSIKRAANMEQAGDLKAWIGAGAWALRQGGALTLIHRGDRLEEIKGVLRKAFGRIRVLPIVTKPGTPAKRVIVLARKGGEPVCSEPVCSACSDFLLHCSTGGYTERAESVLRDAAGIDLEEGL